MSSNRARENVEERRNIESQEDTIDLGRYFAVLRAQWWKIVVLSLIIGVSTLLLLFLKPNIYLASATITPPKENKKLNPAIGVLSSFGVDIGGATDVEDLENLFRSNDLTVRIFRKYDLWPIVMPERYDPKTGMARSGWFDKVFRGESDKPPGEWDAIQIARDWLEVRTNRKLGTVNISFESPSPEGSASIIRYYLEEAKSRLQDEAYDRATKNKQFIEQQIGRTPDALTRDRLFSLYGQEIEREMLARNREQFGFRVVDSPRVPRRKSGPHRAKTAILFTVLSVPVWTVFLFLRKRQGHTNA